MPTLEWIGKEKVINHHQEVPFQILEKKYTYNAESSENMIIHGDNLLALKSLLPQYEGRVDCIYIDPPYNTAHSTNNNQRWVYNDNVDDPHIKKWLGIVVGDEGEDLSRHDKWLCMMYPRLVLLHRILSKEGVIFISIDDNEFHNLKYLLDSIFGRKNHITTFAVENNPKGRKNNAFVSEGYEYCLLYCKNRDATLFRTVVRFVGFSRQKNCILQPAIFLCVKFGRFFCKKLRNFPLYSPKTTLILGSPFIHFFGGDRCVPPDVVGRPASTSTYRVSSFPPTM